jgi:PhnB protein
MILGVHDLDIEARAAFCKRAFGATEKFRLVEPSGRIGHAELVLGNAVLMPPAMAPLVVMIGRPSA